MPNLRVRKPDGWATITMPDEVDVSVAGGMVDGQLTLTLIGARDDGQHVIEAGVLDVDKDDEQLIENEVPRTDNGESLVLRRLLQS